LQSKLIMKHMAAYLLLKLGGNDAPTADQVKTALDTVGVTVDDAALTHLLAELAEKDLEELLESGKSQLATFGGGGGGGGGGGAAPAAAAAAEEKEEEKEEEEMDLGGGMDMFGGDEGGGGGGDY
jgi:large subunit ribosomal protein LP2